MAGRKGTDIVSEVPVTQWQRMGFTATPIRVGIGFRKRRSAPAIELAVGSVRTKFLCRELVPFFDGTIDNIEAPTGGEVSFLYRADEGVTYAWASGEQFADLAVGGIALLATEPVMHPIAVLPPDAAADLGDWFRALPSW